MNPLSAIRQMTASEIQPSALTQLQGTGKINASELQNLASATQISGVNTDNSFGNVLTQLVDEVNQKQINAADANAAVLSGQNVSLHQAVIAMEEASVSFQLMVEVRNKLLESYQELMRMQI